MRKDKGNLYIFDIVRKKNVLCTPEEKVRQTCIHFLINEKKIPTQFINVEKSFWVYKTKKRYDIVVYNNTGGIILLVECKAPNVKITQDTFDQLMQYNLKLNSSYLMISNGEQNFFCKIDSQKKYSFIPSLPLYNKMKIA